MSERDIEVGESNFKDWFVIIVYADENDSGDDALHLSRKEMVTLMDKMHKAGF